MDIYQEIARVCPSHNDLKNMPPEEINRKISHYSAKMSTESQSSQINEMDLE